jgi:peptidoglycan hydrolase CwlO-like protein
MNSLILSIINSVLMIVLYILVYLVNRKNSERDKYDALIQKQLDEVENEIREIQKELREFLFTLGRLSGSIDKESSR